MWFPLRRGSSALRASDSKLAIGPQSLHSAFSLDGMSRREGGGRFDFPTNRGGWS
jgi:hypothetical protein